MQSQVPDLAHNILAGRSCKRQHDQQHDCQTDIHIKHTDKCSRKLDRCPEEIRYSRTECIRDRDHIRFHTVDHIPGVEFLSRIPADLEHIVEQPEP